MAPVSSDAVVGMMDAAYFVGRKELLDFLNDTLDLKLQKIEETAPGHVACQLVDIMFPNTIPMSKVNWGAKNDYEFVQNYKLLQNAFTKQHVQRHIDVDKLIRAKYQDNLEFMQWFKAFFDQSGATTDGYDPASVRAKGKGGTQYNQQYSRASGGATTRSTGASRPSRPPPTRPAAPRATTTTAPPAVPVGRRTGGPLRERPKDVPLEEAVHSNGGAVNELNQKLSKENELLLKEVDELTGKLEEFEGSIREIESERDYYFEKLRNVEVILQVFQEQEDANTAQMVDNIFKVLYATPDDDILVNEAGEVVQATDLENMTP